MLPGVCPVPMAPPHYSPLAQAGSVQLTRRSAPAAQLQARNVAEFDAALITELEW